MKTFSIQTLGCKVNQYESEQVASLLRSRGLVETSAQSADLRIINSCSVTMQAASQSRQSVRRVTRADSAVSDSTDSNSRSRVVIMGCWATSDKAEAAAMAGVDAVLTHQDNVAAEIDRLLRLWTTTHPCAPHPPRPMILDGLIQQAGTAADIRTHVSKAESDGNVNEISGEAPAGPGSRHPPRAVADGTRSVPATVGLPLLADRHTARHRAYLKIQDGCDAHCTYCIIPKLRPTLSSKPIAEAVEEAQRLVGEGHLEIILTGIFLGAYGQSTSLRRRKTSEKIPPLARLIEALCKNVSGLRRLRLSSLEPGDLSEELLALLRSYPQVMPHFHLPLQSGSDLILRRMNRQYNRDDFLRMVEQVNRSFDRPALTTDILVGFPGESDAEFEQTLDVVDQARFVHIHAFQYSPRPGTAAARWGNRFIHQQIVKDRLAVLDARAKQLSFEFRKQFIGDTVEVIAEHRRPRQDANLGQGRCERYFAVHFSAKEFDPGNLVRLRITQVTPDSTVGAH